MYTLSLAVISMCCKKADYMHTNLSSLYTTGCSIATSACKAKKAFASLVQPMYSVGKSNINFEYQMYSYIGFLNIIDQKSKAEGLRLFLLNCDQPKLGGICPPPSVPTALSKYSKSQSVALCLCLLSNAYCTSLNRVTYIVSYTVTSEVAGRNLSYLKPSPSFHQ